MERKIGTVYDASGNPISGVTVNVFKAGTSVNPTIYSDDGISTKSNPFTNDSDGSFEYHARPPA